MSFPRSMPRTYPNGFCVLVLLGALTVLDGRCSSLGDDTLGRIRLSGRLVYGGHLLNRPSTNPSVTEDDELTHFEAELIRMLAKDLGVEPVLAQASRDRLFQVL